MIRMPKAMIAVGLVAAVALTGCASASKLEPATGASGRANASNDTFAKVLADAPVASSIASGSLMAKIKQAAVLRVGGTDAGPVFSIKDPVTGKLTGFDAYLSQLLAKYIIGTPSTKLTLTTVATREALLQNGSVDTVFATYTITSARATKVDFAGPYYSSGDAILVKKSNTSITKVSDLDGKTVATESNSTAAEDIKKYAPGAKVTLFADDNSCVQAVQQGRADAYVLDQGILLGDATKADDVKVVGTPFTQEPYGIGTPKQNPEMKTFVDAWLKMIESDGIWKRVYDLTIGQVASGSAPTPPVIGSVAGS